VAEILTGCQIEIYKRVRRERIFYTDEMLELDRLVVSLKSLIVSFQIFPVAVILLKVENLSEHPA
jgi:hypothetical protein